MRQTIKSFLHDKIAALLDLPPKKVIWANQAGGRQNNPLVTLLIYSQVAEEQENKLAANNPTDIDLRVSTQFVVEVQYFGGTPVDELEKLTRQLERPTVVDAFFANGAAFLYADPVQDLTGLLGNDQQFEPRAAVDLHMRYTAQMIDDPGYIDEVDAVIEIIDPETGETVVDVTGKLIHGNLIKGQEPDIEKAIDVDFSCSAKDE